MLKCVFCQKLMKAFVSLYISSTNCKQLGVLNLKNHAKGQSDVEFATRTRFPCFCQENSYSDPLSCPW